MVIAFFHSEFGSGPEGAVTFTKFRRMVFSKCLVVGWAALIAGALNLAQAQQKFVPPPPPAPPPPPPVVNPSSPNITVPQPSYKPISPSNPSAVPGSEVTSPVNEEPPNTTARSERGASVAKTRSVRHHRGRFVGPTLGSYYCGYSPCVRIYPSALHGYAAYVVVAPASALWWPGFYDYAPGQFAHGRPRYWGYWRRAGDHLPREGQRRSAAKMRRCSTRRIAVMWRSCQSYCAKLD
jgi:hypothetical protein